MPTKEELQNWFRVYYLELDKCRRERAWWASLHMALVIPDVCSSLETPADKVGVRYVRWCRENFPPEARFTPEDRYQMRNAVLHQGTSRPQNKGTDHHSQYKVLSFVLPENEPADHDTHFMQDSSKKNVTVYIQRIVASTFEHALPAWFGRVAGSSVRSAAVKSNLHTLVRLQGKEIAVPVPVGTQPRLVTFATLSSS